MVLQSNTSTCGQPRAMTYSLYIVSGEEEGVLQDPQQQLEGEHLTPGTRLFIWQSMASKNISLM